MVHGPSLHKGRTPEWRGSTQGLALLTSRDLELGFSVPEAFTSITCKLGFTDLREARSAVADLTHSTPAPTRQRRRSFLQGHLF